MKKTKPVTASFACYECESSRVACDEDGCCATCGCDAIFLYGTDRERAVTFEQIVTIVQQRIQEARRDALLDAVKVCDRVAAGGEIKTIGFIGETFSEDARYIAWELRRLLPAPKQGDNERGRA